MKRQFIISKAYTGKFYQMLVYFSMGFKNVFKQFENN